MLSRRESITGRRADLSATVGKTSLFVKNIFEKYGQGERYIFDPVSFVYLLPNIPAEEPEKEAPEEERAREYVLREKETLKLVTRSERSREFITRVLERASMPGPRELLYRRSWKEQLINRVSVILQDCRTFEETFFLRSADDFHEEPEEIRVRTLFHLELRALEQNLEKWKEADMLNEGQYQKQTAQSVSRLLTQRKFLEQREGNQLLAHFRKIFIQQLREEWENNDHASQRVHFIQERMKEILEQISVFTNDKDQTVAQEAQVLSTLLLETDILSLTRRFEEREWHEFPDISENWSLYQICQLQWMLVEKMQPVEWERVKKRLDKEQKLEELELNYPKGEELLYLIEEWVQNTGDGGVLELTSVKPTDEGYEIIQLLHDRVQNLTGQVSAYELEENSIVNESRTTEIVNALLLQQFGLEFLVGRVGQEEWKDFREQTRELPEQKQILEAERLLLHHISFRELEQVQFSFLPQPVQNEMQGILEQMQDQRVTEFLDVSFCRIFESPMSDADIGENKEKELWSGILREVGITTLVKRMDRHEWDQLRIQLENWDSYSQDYGQIQQLLINKLSPAEMEYAERSTLGMYGHIGPKVNRQPGMKELSLQPITKADQGKLIRNLQNIRILDQLSYLITRNSDTEKKMQGNREETVQMTFREEMKGSLGKSTQKSFNEEVKGRPGESTQKSFNEEVWGRLGESTQKSFIEEVRGRLGESKEMTFREEVKGGLGESTRKSFSEEVKRRPGESTQKSFNEEVWGRLGESTQKSFSEEVNVRDMKYDVREIIDGIQLILQEFTAGSAQDEWERLVNRSSSVLERVSRRLLPGYDAVNNGVLQLLSGQEYPLWQEASQEIRRYGAMDAGRQSVVEESFLMSDSERDLRGTEGLTDFAARDENLLFVGDEPLTERMSQALRTQINRALESVGNIPHMESDSELTQRSSEKKASAGQLQLYQANSRMIKQQQEVQQEQLNQLRKQTIQQSEVIREIERQQRVLIKQIEEPKESLEEIERRTIQRLENQLRLERMRRGLA